MDVKREAGEGAIDGSAKSNTPQNVASLFAREAQTLARYRRFASTARHEGYSSAASLFERLAQNQAIVVEGHLDLLRSYGDPLNGLPLGATRDNLESALAAELEEGRELYPALARAAEAEGFSMLAGWLHTLARTKDYNASRLAGVLNEARASAAMDAGEAESGQ